MKLKLPFLFICLLFTFSSILAQSHNLEGSWKLEEVELKDFSDESLSFPVEESFFGYYLNSTESLIFQADALSLVVGGDTEMYNYEVSGSKLKLITNNTVLVLSKGKQEEFSGEGETVFKLKISGNKIHLSRRNQTFFESYSFSKLN